MSGRSLIRDSTSHSTVRSSSKASRLRPTVFLGPLSLISSSAPSIPRTLFSDERPSDAFRGHVLLDCCSVRGAEDTSQEAACLAEGLEIVRLYDSRPSTACDEPA
ncbi:hypothetical protein T08_15443 [Trichinella sp. T8]|nr:hypothetical protein T08_15443 [Trichinella sp. T8]